VDSICIAVLTFPRKPTLTLSLEPISAIHSRKAEIAISLPIVTATGRANHHRGILYIKSISDVDTIN